jgi:DNA-binding beta-propeller fold protein YncE
MDADKGSSSDRLTVIVLVLLCLLLIIFIAGLIVFLGGGLALFFTGTTDGHGNMSAGNNPLPAGSDSIFSEPRAYIGELDSGLVGVLNASSGQFLGEIQTSAGASGIVVSNNGSRVYINNGNGIAVVDARTNRIINNITTSHAVTGFLVLSPDNAYLYAACSGGLSIIALAGDSGVEIAFIDGVVDTGLGVSPDCKYVYSTDWWNCKLQVTNIDERRIQKTIDLIPADYSHMTQPWEGKSVMQAGQAEALAVSPDGRYAVIGIWANSYVAVVDLQSMILVKAVTLNGRSFQGVTYSPDGKYVYIADYDGEQIIALDGTSFTPRSSFNVAPRPRNIAITPDGRYMYVAHDHGDLEIVQLPDGDAIKTIMITANKEGSNIAFNPAVPGTRGNGSASASPVTKDNNFSEPRAYICRFDSKAVSVLNASTGLPLGKIVLSHSPSGVVVSPDGNYVYINDGSVIAVVDARTNTIINNISTSQPTTGYLTISPDNRRLYVVCNNGMSVIALAKGGGIEIGFINNVSAMGIGISPDGKYVFTTDWGICLVQVINTGELRIEKTIDLIPASVSHGTIPWQGMQVKAAGQAVGLAVSPDGRHAVVGIWAGSFAPVVDLQGMTLEKAVPLNGRSYQCVAFSPDGKWVYISHYDGNRIVVLDGSTFAPISSLNTAASPKNIAITPDNKYLYVTHENGPVEIIGLPYGGDVKTLDFAASKDGMNLAFNPAAT